jgi:hypothetical protein
VSSGPVPKGDFSEPLRLGGGVGVGSTTGDLPFVTASARKRVALLDVAGGVLLTAKARIDLQPSSGKARRYWVFLRQTEERGTKGDGCGPGRFGQAPRRRTLS